MGHFTLYLKEVVVMVKFYPVVGESYIVTECDGSKNEVVVRAVLNKLDSVVFEYVGVGLLNYTTTNEFAFELNAFGMQ